MRKLSGQLWLAQRQEKWQSKGLTMRGLAIDHWQKPSRPRGPINGWVDNFASVHDRDKAGRVFFICPSVRGHIARTNRGKRSRGSLASVLLGKFVPLFPARPSRPWDFAGQRACARAAIRRSSGNSPAVRGSRKGEARFDNQRLALIIAARNLRARSQPWRLTRQCNAKRTFAITELANKMLRDYERWMIKWYDISHGGGKRGNNFRRCS